MLHAFQGGALGGLRLAKRHDSVAFVGAEGCGHDKVAALVPRNR